MVYKNNIIFSLSSANSTHFLWLIFQPQHKHLVFLALQGYCFLQSCAPALSESPTWAAGDSRNRGSAGTSLCGLFVLVLSCPLNCGLGRHKQCLPTARYFLIHTLNLPLCSILSRTPPSFTECLNTSCVATVLSCCCDPQCRQD